MANVARVDRRAVTLTRQASSVRLSFAVGLASEQGARSTAAILASAFATPALASAILSNPCASSRLSPGCMGVAVLDISAPAVRKGGVQAASPPPAAAVSQALPNSGSALSASPLPSSAAGQSSLDGGESLDGASIFVPMSQTLTSEDGGGLGSAAGGSTANSTSSSVAHGKGTSNGSDGLGIMHLSEPVVIAFIVSGSILAIVTAILSLIRHRRRVAPAPRAPMVKAAMLVPGSVVLSVPQKLCQSPKVLPPPKRLPPSMQQTWIGGVALGVEVDVPNRYHTALHGLPVMTGVEPLDLEAAACGMPSGKLSGKELTQAAHTHHELYVEDLAEWP